MPKQMRASVNFTNDKSVLPVFLAFTESFSRLYGISGEQLNRVLLSAEEAFCYTADNAYEEGETGEIGISAEYDSRGLTLVFHDSGLPFDMSVLNSYNPLNPDADLSSLGLYLIQKTADEVKWEHKGAQGNLLTIRFYGSYKDITEIEDVQHLPQEIPPAPEQVYTIKFADADDAVHISRCLYRTYGYSYPAEWMYYPDKIVNRIDDKSLISVVAVCENGDVAGHLSLDVKVKNILAESGQAIVDPRHRSRHLLERMKELLNRRALELGLFGIFSEPVTNHTRSQQTSLKTGNFSCGLMLGYIPTGTTFKKIENDDNELRRSCVYNYMPLKDRGVCTLYVPAVYKELLGKIYAGCGLSAEIGTDEKMSASDATEMNYAMVSSMGFGVITFKKIGSDCAEQLKQGLFHLTMRMSADMVYLNLPMEDKNCVYLINRAREMGFVFCTAAMALDDGRDMLRMQFLNCTIDYGGIQLVGDTAQFIFDFIKTELKI